MKKGQDIITAVIDDGINWGLYNNGPLKFDMEITRELAVQQRQDYAPLLPSHGTTCAAIIKKYAQDIELGSIRILDTDSRRAVKHQLIAAIRLCTENGVRLVNLSLGTIDFRDFEEIRECVNEAYRSGLIIIAACNNKNIYTVPACLTNVIGVKCRPLFIDGRYKFIPYAFDGIDIAASGRHCLTDYQGNNRYTSSANSFAVPLVTALAYHIIKRNPEITLEGIKGELYRCASNCKNDGYNPFLCMHMDWLDSDMIRYTAGSLFQNDKQQDQPDRKTWSPEFYKMRVLETLSESQRKIDIPVIVVFDPEHNGVTEDLHFLFRKEGYYAITVSTDYNNVLSGSEYLPEGIQAGQFLSMVYKKYCCDVILIHIHANKLIESIDKSVLIDIMLHIGNNEQLQEYMHRIKNDCRLIVFTLNKEKSEEQVEAAFKQILKLLEGD